MADVTTKFLAESAQAEAAIAKLQVKIEELKQKMKGVHEESKKGHDQSSHYMKEQIRDVGALVAGYFTLGGAVEFLSGTYKEWRKEIEQLGKASAEFQAQVVKAVTQAGALAELPKVDEWLRNVKGATREQALAAFQGVTESDPTQAFARRRAVAGQIVRAAPMQLDMKALGGVGGEVARVAPGMAPEDVADTSLLMQQFLGAKVEAASSPQALAAVEIMQKKGFSFEKAFAITGEAMIHGMTGKQLKGLAAQFKTPEAFDKLMAMKPEARARHVKGGVAAGEMLGLLDPRHMATMEKGFAGVAGDDVVGRQLAELSKSTIGREVAEGQALTAAGQLAATEESAEGRHRTRLEQFLGAQMNRAKWGPWHKQIQWAKFYTDQAIFGDLGAMGQIAGVAKQTRDPELRAELERFHAAFLAREDRIVAELKKLNEHRADTRPRPGRVEAAPEH